MKEKCNVGECLKILGIDGEKRRVKKIKKKIQNDKKWKLRNTLNIIDLKTIPK